MVTILGDESLPFLFCNFPINKRYTNMKNIITKLITSFPIELCIDFIQTKGNIIEHPKFGFNKLSEFQFNNSLGWYKQKIYKNIQACLQEEIDLMLSGEKNQECLDAPLVNSPYMSLLWKHEVHNSSKLNRWLKYPELMERVDAVLIDLKEIVDKEMTNIMSVESKMPYKSQFLLEEVIERVEGWKKSI